MSTDHLGPSDSIVPLSAEVVAAYVGNNSVHLSDLPALIDVVHGAFRDLGAPQPPVASARPTPPVSVKKSVTPDYLISLEDGRHYKSLKRHLAGRGLTPAEYRAKWGLSTEYPMVAPNYAKHRSDLAKAAGLGRKRPEPVVAARAGGRRRKGG